MLTSLSLIMPSTAIASECLSINLRGLKDAPDASRKDFRVNEMVVICVHLQEAAFVSIWDAPQIGDYKRLFPNQLSHPPAGKASAWLNAGKEHCFGVPGTFPIYIPPGQGSSGKLTVLASRSEDKHLTEDDVRIPGKASPEKFQEAARSFRSQAPCGDVPQMALEYQVRQ
jgi:hypothetical protein